MILEAVGRSRPYPDHGLASPSDRSDIAPCHVRLDQLITTKATLDLETLLDADSTFCGDLVPHVVRWAGELYLEDGLHCALRTALHHRTVLHARVLDLDADPAARSGTGLRTPR